MLPTIMLLPIHSNTATGSSLALGVSICRLCWVSHMNYFEGVQLVETGVMPLRPGVKRLVEDAVPAGDCYACCVDGVP
jgi:hypothetical protein